MDHSSSHPFAPSTVELFASLNAKFNEYVEGGGSASSPFARRSPASPGSSRPARREDADAVAARLSLAGVYERSISDGPSSDSHITGFADRRQPSGKMKNERLEWHDPALKFAPQAGTVLTRLTWLNVPIVRPGRPQTAARVSSFHFDFKPITKTRAAAIASGSGKMKQGVGQKHARYVEREGAIEQFPRPEFGIAMGVQTDREPELEIGPSEAQREARYVEAGAQDTTTGASLTIFSNISEDYAERIAFWGSVEERERSPGSDKILIDFSRNAELWRAVANDPQCPPEFAKNAKLFLRETSSQSPSKHGAQRNQEPHQPTPTAPVSIVSGDNQKLRKLMRHHGWSRSTKSRADGESGAAKKHASQSQQICDLGFAFSNARGGRIQYRLVGELPVEVGHEGRVRILRGMAMEFERRGLPYTAVPHEPDHDNDKSNWHFHLIAHDQPAKRFTGHAADHVPPLRDGAGPKEREMHQVMCAAICSPEVQAQIGKWDFEVAYKRKDKSRRTKTSYPFAQRKNREINSAGFIPHLRKTMADLVNEELARCSAGRQVDHRNFKDMGIDKVPEQHLGNKRAQLEKHGIPTAMGVENERNQWTYRLKEIAAVRDTALDDLDAFGEDFRKTPADLSSIGRSIDYRRALCEVLEQERSRVEDDYQLSLVREVLGRAHSRSMSTMKTCRALLEPLTQPSPRPAGGPSQAGKISKRAALESRIAEAQSHHERTDAFFADLRVQMDELIGRKAPREKKERMLARRIHAIKQQHASELAALATRSAAAASIAGGAESAAHVETGPTARAQHNAAHAKPSTPVSSTTASGQIPPGEAVALRKDAREQTTPKASQAATGREAFDIGAQAPPPGAPITSATMPPATAPWDRAASSAAADTPAAAEPERVVQPAKTATAHNSDPPLTPAAADVAPVTPDRSPAPENRIDAYRSIFANARISQPPDPDDPIEPPSKQIAGDTSERPPATSEQHGGPPPTHVASPQSAPAPSTSGRAQSEESAFPAAVEKAPLPAADRASQQAAPAPGQIANRSNMTTGADKLEMPRSSAGGSASELAADADALSKDHQANEIQAATASKGATRETADRPAPDASPAKRFGVRTLGTSGALAAQSDTKQDQQEPAAAQSRDSGFDIEAELVRSENLKIGSNARPVIKREPGLHLLIDAWIAADLRGDVKGSCEALAAIVADSAASAIAERFVSLHRKAIKQVRDNQKPEAALQREERGHQAQRLQEQSRDFGIGDSF